MSNPLPPDPYGPPVPPAPAGPPAAGPPVPPGHAGPPVASGYAGPPVPPAYAGPPVPPQSRPTTSPALSYIALALGIASPGATVLGFLLGNVSLWAYDSPIRGLFGALPWLAGLAAIVVGIIALVRRSRARGAAIIGMLLPIVGHILMFFAWVLIFVGVMTAVGVGSGG